MTPETRYAKSGDVNIAYQVVGNGPRDLVVVPGWLSNIEVFWDGLVTHLRRGVGEGFVRPEYAALLLTETSPAALLDRFTAWSPPAVARVWLDPTQI